MGAGVIVISIAFGICGQCITIAVLCLALNLIMSSFFILAVKQLLVYADLDDTKHGVSRDPKTGEPVPLTMVAVEIAQGYVATENHEVDVALEKFEIRVL